MWREFHKTFKEIKAKGLDFLEEFAKLLRPRLVEAYEKQSPNPNATKKYIPSRILSAWFLTTPRIYKNRVIEEIERKDIRVVFPNENINGLDISGRLKDAPIAFVRQQKVPRGYVAVMCDAALLETKNGRTWMVGIVILNDNSELESVEDWKAKVVGPMKDNIEAELQAIIEGLQFVEERGYTKVVIFSDCETVVSRLNLKGSLGQFVNLYIDAWCLLNNFKDHEVRYVARECNRAANSVAKLADKFPFEPELEHEIIKMIKEDKDKGMNFRYDKKKK